MAKAGRGVLPHAFGGIPHGPSDTDCLVVAEHFQESWALWPVAPYICGPSYNLPCQPVPGPQQTLKQAHLSGNEPHWLLSTLLLLEHSIQLREGRPGRAPAASPRTPLTPSLLSNTATASAVQDLRTEDGGHCPGLWLHPQIGLVCATARQHSSVTATPPPALPFLAELYGHACPHATCECTAFGLLRGLNENAGLLMKIKCLSVDCSILQNLSCTPRSSVCCLAK